MRRLEVAIIFLVAMGAASASGLWLRTEWNHHAEAMQIDRMLNQRPLETDVLEYVLMKFPFPSQDILPGKHLFYGSTLGVAAADLSTLSEPLRLKWLEQARQALPDALSREPSHTHSWVHLAYTEWLLKGPNLKSVEALRMSIYTSPANRQVMLWRLKLAGLNREFWAEGFQDLILGQVSQVWRHDPKTLAGIAATYHICDLVRQVLSNDPEELARFDSLVPKSPKS